MFRVLTYEYDYDSQWLIEAQNAAPSEVLVGTVERVTLHNGETGFAVLKVKARGERDLITIVGLSGPS